MPKILSDKTTEWKKGFKKKQTYNTSNEGCIFYSKSGLLTESPEFDSKDQLPMN